MTCYESLLTQASQLPVLERVQLIEALWETVPDEALPAVSEEWMAEIQRRSAELDAGQAETIPWEHVRSEAFKRSGLNEAD